ncbi:hypothetical protein HanRHA438_Chr15g0729131 [Helianthus annuus]|nr:hypothetical protein HanRHA438_Chr15g0729131 [Helianthus annuus]
MACASGGLITSSHVLLSCKALYSVFMASSQVGSDWASIWDLGTGDIGCVVEVCKVYGVLVLMVPSRVRVTIGCRGGGGGGDGAGE